MPCGVQISVQGVAPLECATACEIVGAMAKPKTANKAIHEQRRRW